AAESPGSLGQLERGLRARLDGVPDLGGQLRRHVAVGDVQFVLVVQAEDRRDQARAHAVGLAQIAVHGHSHGGILLPSVPVPAPGRRQGKIRPMPDPRAPPGQPSMPDELRRAAEAARGFMPPPEGLALYRAAADYAAAGPVLEIGTYCSKSPIYPACAAPPAGQGMITPDHPPRSGGNPPRLR